MADGEPASIPEHSSELSEHARLLLEALRQQAEPMDAIGLSSATRLPMEAVLAAVEELTESGAVERVAPEPVHQRIAVPA